MEDLTLSGMIRKAIQEEMRFERHYDGTVINIDDTMNKGRVKVKIPDLGWDTDDKAAWCSPRTRHGMDVPKVGESVEVYFIAGKRNRPVYMGQVDELDGNLPALYSKPTDRILFQDPDSGDSLVYDSITKTLKITATAVQINGSAHTLVTDALSTALATFTTALNAALATKLNGAGSAGTLTIDISSALTTTVKTGG